MVVMARSSLIAAAVLAAGGIEGNRIAVINRTTSRIWRQQLFTTRLRPVANTSHWKQVMSKTQEAIALVNQGMTPFAAAKQIGLSPNTLYVALKKQREKQGIEACPCCGSLVQVEKIKRDVLKEPK